jgi:hypothetical protein
METKICSKCKIEKDLSEFGRDSSRKNGISYLCKLCLIEKSRSYKKRNKEKVLISYSRYRENNKEKMKLSRNEYIIKNKDKITKYRTFYSDKRRKESNVVRISENIRRRINVFLKSKNFRKNNNTFQVVGCTPEFLKEYLESKFTEGMSWDNYGYYGWHIDHIIPLSLAKDEKEIYKFCHYTNLQPLWALENLSKGNKINSV